MNLDPMSEIFQGRVLTLTSEGQGVLRHNNFVVFIPFTAPGDRILYRIINRKKNFAQGELIEVLEPSPIRTVPLCRYYGRCGGCQLQHMTYKGQLESKRQMVEDALKRIGKFPEIFVEPVVAAQLNWAYRRHVTLKIVATEEFLKAGYIAVDHVSFVPVEHCPIFISEDDPAIQELQCLLRNFSTNNFLDGKAVLFKNEDHKLILSLRFKPDLPPMNGSDSNSFPLEARKNKGAILANITPLFSEPLVRASREKITSNMTAFIGSKSGFNKSFTFPQGMIEDFLKKYPRWIGIVIHIDEKKWTWGEVKAVIKVDELRLICSPDVFTQNHPEQSLKIYQHVSNLVSLPHAKVWDLYCGIGISSLLLAKQGHAVIGVEYNHESVELAKENALLNQIETAQFIQGDVEQILQRKLEKPDVIVINPPRIGITPLVIKEILKRKPKIIIYVSCMPSTLARDLNRLCADGYKISLVQPYDMFPQTSHVETLVQLLRDR